MEEVRFIDVDRVSIPIQEYRELIETKCKAEAEADSRQSDWYRENSRANRAESELEELKAKFEELRAKYEEELKQNGRD
jgi:hypothetical protein